MEIKQIIGLLLLFIVCSCNCFAQADESHTEAKYNDFVDRYMDEIVDPDSVQSDDQKEVVVIWPDTLPDWIFEPVDNNVIIGISDPGLDSTRGFAQALHRAGLIASMFEESHIGFIADNYKKETGTSLNKIIEVYGRFHKTLSQSLHFDDYEILDYHITKFSETIIRIRPDRTSPYSDSIILITESLLEEKASGDAADIRFKTVLTSGLLHQDEFIPVMEYEVKGINKHASIYSIFYRDSIEYPETRCKYYYENNELFTDSALHARKLVPINLDYGIWNAYVQSLLRKIYHDVFRKAEVNVSKLSDDFNANRQHLKRELTREKFRIEINKVILKNRHLIVDLEIIQ